MSLLDSSIKVGSLELRNRLVMPPMATAKSQADGKATEELCDYYEEKSHGGHIGLIITEHSFISPAGKASKGQLSIAQDSDVAGLKKIVAAIQQNQTPVFAQISHAGALAKKEITGCEPLSASAVALPKTARNKRIPQEMTDKDIQKVIVDFAAAALRAKQAGFDGVELHSAHGYLLNQFYSPLTNKREDHYTGHSLAGRIRLHLEIIEAIRRAVGKDYPLALRLGASDHLAGGTTIEDSIIAAQEFEKAGIRLLDISGGYSFYTHPMNQEQGYFSELTEAIKRKVNIPVLLTGGITEAAAAERLLREEKADLIGVGRAILKDSNWAAEALAIP